MTITIETEHDVHAEAATILQKAVCLTLRCSALGNNRKIDLKTLVEAAGGDNELNEAQFHATMRLIDPKALLPANRLLSQAKAFVRSRAIPTPHVFGERSYLLPNDLIVGVDEELRGYKARVRAEAFLVAEAYEAEREKQRALVPAKVFEAAKYPTTAQVAAAFDITWHYTSFKAADNIATVDSALFDVVKREHDALLGDAFAEVKLALRAGAKQIVDTLAGKLRRDDDGKPKVFRDTILNDLLDYLSTFRARDITNDAELSSEVERLRALTAGVDPQQLRDDESLRDHMLAAIAEASTNLDGMVQKVSRRAIAFGGL